MSESYRIVVLGKEFIVVFGSTRCVLEGEQIVNFDRTITTCSIIELPGRQIYSGSAIKCPKDMFDSWEGRRWAFKRAVLQLFLIWSMLGKSPYKYFNNLWQNFRRALGQNQKYLSERKEK